MDFAKIRPRGGTKAQWETANPVLGKREMGIQWESEIGVGKVVIKFGNGVTAWNNLDTAVEVENDLVNKIISSIVTVSDEYPILNDGDSLSTLVGKIKKYIQDLKDKKLDKSARYDGTDSTSTELVPTANALRGVNAKADKNASDITTLNNNLSNQTDRVTQLYSDMSNYRAIIVNDTPADDIPSLLKAKAKLISNQNKGQGFYAIIGGWQGKTYGFSIGNVIGGKITIACFLNNNCYLATCDYSNPESNFSYTTMKPDLSPYITKSQLFAAQSQSFLVNKSTTIDRTLFSTANFKAQRPNNGTGAASYGFENIGINSGALYLDPTDYKLHFINYEGNDFTINWTKN